MGAKLERLGAELAKARKKKAEWDSRVKVWSADTVRRKTPRFTRWYTPPT